MVLYAQQQAAMQCHLGLSQGKYCDRALTFVPFTVRAQPRDWDITPKTHTRRHKSQHKLKNSSHFFPLVILSTTYRHKDGGYDNVYFCEHVFRHLSDTNEWIQHIKLLKQCRWKICQSCSPIVRLPLNGEYSSSTFYEQPHHIQ